MAQIKFLPFIRHVRAEPSRHLILYRHGKKKRSGRGIAFWFTPLAASLVEIPCDDREVSFLFHARSEDYQDVNVQGSITFGLPDLGDQVTLHAGDRLDLPAGVVHNAIVGSNGVVCFEAHR